jgi:hypothetical protein
MFHRGRETDAMTRQRWPRFELILEARPPRAVEGMPTPPPPELRLRRALKCLLRSFDFGCISAKRVVDDAGQDAGVPPAPGTTAPNESESTP